LTILQKEFKIEQSVYRNKMQLEPQTMKKHSRSTSARKSKENQIKRSNIGD
jgi:hypothetical protein